MLNNVELEINVDGQPCVWQVYRPEEDQYKDPNMYLWVRRCELFVNWWEIAKYFDKLGIFISTCHKHELFPELFVIGDDRGKKWYICQASIYGTHKDSE